VLAQKYLSICYYSEERTRCHVLAWLCCKIAVAECDGDRRPAQTVDNKIFTSQVSDYDTLSVTAYLLHR